MKRRAAFDEGGWSRLIPQLPNWLLKRLRHLNPVMRTAEERLASFPVRDLPLEHPVKIRWNRYQVPFIEAKSDRDLAFTLGLVHAHLRTGQINFLHRLSTGRLAELFGPLAVEVDHALRIVDMAHAVPEIEAQMPAETRAWLEPFIDGLNFYWETNPELPPDLAFFGAKTEPWALRDMLVLGRMIGVDFYWITLLNLLSERGKENFSELWRRVRESGEASAILAPLSRSCQSDLFGELLVANNRAGSNSVAVAPERSATGGAWIANDPHLGFGLPNLFLLAGMRSPSFEMVGMMMPGVPLVMVGRNPDMAWGATNLRAASSDLYDVTELPPESIETKTVTIRTRFWRQQKRIVRRSPFGPILSDAKLCPSTNNRLVALRWVGHEATDEFTALLKASKAKTPESFRAAFETYGQTPLNMVFADRSGNIGELMAVKQPIRNSFPEDDIVLDANNPETHWQGFANALDLPWSVNPEQGFVVSANHRPAESNILIGYLYGIDSRKKRLETLLLAKERMSFADLIDLQTDTCAPEAGTLALALADEIEYLLNDDPALQVAHRLRHWGGDYSADSQDAVLFELLLYHLCHAVFDGVGRAAVKDQLCQWSYIATFLLRDLANLAFEQRAMVVSRAIHKATAGSVRYPTWGDMHRLKLAHVLHHLPLIGRSFVFDDLPLGGSRQTPMKTAHGLVKGKHYAHLGSMARHISDLSDLDANWFTILGGQDGWLGAENFHDQVALWSERRYIRMPLRPEAVAQEFPEVMTLEPQQTILSNPPLRRNWSYSLSSWKTRKRQAVKKAARERVELPSTRRAADL